MQLLLRQNHLLLIIVIFLSGCATRYRPVNPAQINYGSKAEKSDVEIYYRYDVMSLAKNVKQTNKELRNDVKVIAVKIYNNTTQQITIGENAKFYAGEKELNVLPTAIINRQMKQGIIPYFAYLILSPIKFSYEKDNGAKTVEIFGGAVIGSALTAGNVYVASKANKNLKKELETYSLDKKNILPGETVYGIIAVQKTGYVPVSLKLVR